MDPQCDEIKKGVAKENMAVIKGHYKRDFKSNIDGGLPDKTGLCLSGGGIRAALISIGVMRALAASKEAAENDYPLSEFDYISAVSGGGYALSWYLAANQIKGDKVSSALSQVGFQKTVNSLRDGGRLFTTWEYALGGLKWLSRRPPWVFEGRIWNNGVMTFDYADAIDNTFIQGFQKRYMRSSSTGCVQKRYEGELPAGGVSIDSLSGYPPKNQFIWNASIANASSSSPIDRVFEFNRDSIGNEVLGFRPYSDLLRNNDLYYASKARNLADISAVSGAAVQAMLYRNAFILDRQRLRKHELRLVDGGIAENLGVLSLIKRGVNKLVIVDAEYNPELEYEGYLTLKRVLACDELRLQLYVSTIEDAIAEKCKVSSSVYHRGTVTGLYVLDAAGNATERVISIEYLKLALPSEIMGKDLGFSVMDGGAYRSKDKSEYYQALYDLIDIYDEKKGSPMSQAADANEGTLRTVIEKAIEYYLKDNFGFKMGCRTARSGDLSILDHPELVLDSEWAYPSMQNGRKLKGDLALFKALLAETNTGDLERQLAAARVAKYSHYLNDVFPSSPCDYMAECIFGSYRFPQTTTCDQSYYCDQAEAYLSLGFIMGKQLDRTR